MSDALPTPVIPDGPSIPDDLATVRDTLLAAERVVITSHLRPDGDALGSTLGLALFLRGLGKTVHCFNPDVPPRNLGWLLDELGEVVQFDTGDMAHVQAVAEADVIAVVDTNAKQRLGWMGNSVQGAKTTKVLIDHHPRPENWFDQTYVRTEAASTAELIYDLIAAHDVSAIDTGIATALYTGIVTDTGSFRFGATRPSTHRIVADLMERGGITPEPIHIAIYDGVQREDLRLLSLALKTIRTHYDGRLATLYVAQQMLDETGAPMDASEPFVQYALSLDGVEAAVIFREVKGGVKASFRSKGDCPINGWAARFKGGGHPNAAGAFVKGGELHDTIKRVVKAAPEHLTGAPEEFEASDTLSAETMALLQAMREQGG
ncbi:MAG: bifunctional oligoribonuclease/PAP phosphatase NrnA [Bacteroidota bacterium]